MAFSEELNTLCSRAMGEAIAKGDIKDIGACLYSIATVLGRAIAFAADGDQQKTMFVLTACNEHSLRAADELSVGIRQINQTATAPTATVN